MYYTRKPINFQRQFSKLLRGIIDRSNIRLKKKREAERDIHREEEGRESERERDKWKRREGNGGMEERKRERERGRKKETRSGLFGISFSEPSRDDLIGPFKRCDISIRGTLRVGDTPVIITKQTH